MNDGPPKSHQHRAIQRHAGRPRQPEREGELTRWQRFLALFCPWFREKGKLANDLGEQVARAEARRRTAEARKAEAEARRTAAEADEIAARVDQQRMKNVKQACDLADEYFGQDASLASAIKIVALDKLTSDAAKQIAHIREMLAELRERRGTQVQAITDSARANQPPGSE